MTASELTELAARVEAGSGEDRRLDAEIALTIDADRWKPYVHSDGEAHIQLPRWTSSLDAVVALIAERLPEWDHEYHVTFVDGPPISDALVYNRDHQCGGRIDGVFPSRALLAAALRALRALAAQQQDRQTEGE